MITLFKKNETNFETNGLGSLDKNIINPEISWRDNGAFTLEFKYPLFAKHGKEIENSSIIRANDPEGSNLFFVYKITPSMGYVNVLCYQISYKLVFNSIGDTNIVNKNGQNALTQMSSATQYPHGFVFSSDIQTTANSRVVRKNPIEFLLDSKLDNSFINRWGGHIVRHNFNVAMNSAYGSNKGYTIRHRKDLKGYEAEFDESTVVTRIRPLGYDGLLLPETYVDSPLINAYTEPRIQEIEYSEVKVKTKDTDEEGFSTTELAYAELRRLAQLEFSKNKVDQPDFTAKVEFVNLKETQEYQDLRSLKQLLAGDTVKVIHADDNFNIQAQMVEYKWNPLNQSYISITLGNYTKSFTSTVVNTQNEISKVKETAQNALTSANGKNTVYSLTYKPPITASSVEGDLLYLKNGDKIEMWILEKVDGKLQWVVKVSDATQEELKAQMAQAQNDIADAVNSANSAVDKANANVQAIQENTQLITDVNVIAENAKTQAQTAITNAQTAATNANTAMTNANKAISDVGILSEDVLALDTIANQAKSDADTALINANKGITDAKTALNKATGVDTRVTTEITNVNNTLATKANSTTVDALSDTVSSQGTAISQNATDIKLKADSTVVNAIKGTVDSQGTLISQNSKNIALKANQSSVDTLSGIVSDNKTAIDVTAQGVSTLVTKTDSTNTSLSQFKQDYEGFKGTVYSKTQTDTKISTVQSTVDNFKTTVSNTYSSKTETDSKVTAVQANVDKIGNYTAYSYSPDGTDRFTTVYPNLNLIEDGKFAKPISSNWYTDGTTISKDDITGYFKVKFNGDSSLNRVYYGGSISTIPIGQKYSVYIKAYSLESSLNIKMGSINTSQDVIVTNNSNIPKTYKVEGLVRGDSNTFGILGGLKTTLGTLFISEIKLEQGSIATPWMPSEKEQTSNDIPKYVGYSVRQSENPKDFSWQPYSGLNSYKIIEATTSIEQNSKEIALKSNKSEVDTLSGRVSTAEGAITTMAGQIKLKANQTDVDTVKGRVTTAEGSISTMAGQISLKANRSDVDTVTNRVTATESSLSLQDGKITALTSRTDGNSTQIGKLQTSYDGLSSTVATVQTSVSNINTSNTNLLIRKNEVKDSMVGLDGTIQNCNGSSVIGYSDRISVTGGESLYFSQYYANMSADNYFRYAFYNSTGTLITRAVNNTVNFLVVAPSGASYLRVSYATANKVKVERGNSNTGFVLNQEDTATFVQYSNLSQTVSSLQSTVADKASTAQVAILSTQVTSVVSDVSTQKSQITQLASDINLRVTKGDVTSQINIEAGRTLIDTKQLLLNANNVKFSGSAFIPNSVIQNLSAEKITAGTLNAANVNVINLNAKSLTAGTISGTNLSLNLDTGAVQFQKGYIAGNNNKIRFDLDNNYFQSLNYLNQGFVVKDGIFNFYSSYSLNDGVKIGDISADILAKGSGIQVSGEDGVFLTVKKHVASIGIGTGGLANGNEVSIFGNTYFWNDLMVLGKKNAIHITRDGVRETPAYETAESYLGDIGGNYTRENCEVWVDIEKLFSDTVNTDVAYHVFLQSYDDARFWVAEFKSDKFLIKSDKPMARFAWELKAKRRGYENDRLVIQEGLDNDLLDKAHDEGSL